jgi:hypothetical protein
VVGVPKPDVIGLQNSNPLLIGQPNEVLVQDCSDELPEIVAWVRVILASREGLVAGQCAED